jgi:hypothetical protein
MARPEEAVVLSVPEPGNQGNGDARDWDPCDLAPTVTRDPGTAAV